MLRGICNGWERWSGGRGARGQRQAGGRHPSSGPAGSGKAVGSSGPPRDPQGCGPVSQGAPRWSWVLARCAARDLSDVSGWGMAGNFSLFSLSPKLPRKLGTSLGCLECLFHASHDAGRMYPLQVLSGHCKKDVLGDEKGVRKGLVLPLSFLECQII